MQTKTGSDYTIYHQALYPLFPFPSLFEDLATSVLDYIFFHIKASRTVFLEQKAKCLEEVKGVLATELGKLWYCVEYFRKLSLKTFKPQLTFPCS